ncbi:NnrS family protein [Burkholderia thailandensis]|uniref:Membrane protein, putative n=1 Tax=Burkholderia thailandensis (strain ATCC 700388 / DSM 13276 / CCUG 48851 / CIP 106301 / E264) TaxID=271848 RepID=Q2SXK7_BURTA|nr:NnrS family protein [Burkholderia thailandensis]ABC37661.1 membrane protein, putative [Burkholderia thailandensis E264]AHI73748.1 nnrS family protein [Burkholderia thailandensis 2002721723]AHI78717.1 nnrS family protein [Burkholderia thailandensis E444]AIC86625.1 nnrS family protein [Burkholderia thailandensis USAMRU Malaysia \
MPLVRSTNHSPLAPPDGPRAALWSTGFRPFYLGGACFGAIAMLAWLGALAGHDSAGHAAPASGLFWHAHEMVFGFGGAIVSGFLLTSLRTWTSTNPAQGPSLAALWLLWLAGRVLMWTGPGWAAAAVDVAFLPAIAYALVRALIGAKNRHGIFLPIALGMLAALNALFHLWVRQGHADWALRCVDLAAGLLVLFIVIIGGRIIPSITTAAQPGLPVKQWRIVESSVMSVTLAALIADAMRAPAPAIASLAGAAAALHTARLVGWRFWAVRRRPMLSILHAAYASIVAGFALTALSAYGLVAHSLALHAFTTGVIGCAIIGMITRTALEHTGREPVANVAERVCYGLLIAATLARVAGPWLAPAATAQWLVAAGVGWTAALLVYVACYAGLLTSPAPAAPGSDAKTSG